MFLAKQNCLSLTRPQQFRYLWSGSLWARILSLWLPHINGYEGTGRSLSLKLIQQLREQSRGGANANKDDTEVADKDTGRASRGEKSFTGGRKLREITLSEPIRYAPGDAVEKWLNRVLCLDATLPKAKTNIHGTPHPSTCQLVHVNRDTLFSFHPISEQFLQQMIALYVASHYKNSPNDLQLMSDAPAHQLFVLIPPVKEDASTLPEPLCVLQVALEGRISKQSVMNSLTRGQRAGGDLIPWLVSQQFQDSEFASLSGSRVVRIATNPEYLSMGYGSRALQLLTDFYEGKFVSLSESEATIQDAEHMPRVSDADLESANLLDDDVKVRDINKMPALFSKLEERTPDQLDYVGVSFGLTQQLHKFWKRASFAPVYLRQTANELTGEHSCIMLRPLATPSSNDSSWLGLYAQDFQKRFLTLLSYQFRNFPSVQSLSISESASRASTGDTSTKKGLSKAGLDEIFTPFDLARLDSYANNMLDYHVILDLMPAMAILYFTSRLSTPPCNVNLSGVQQSILLAIGLQRKDLSEVEKELNVASSQLLAMFVKVVRKISTAFRALQEKAVEESFLEKKTTVRTNRSDKLDEKAQEGSLNRVPLQHRKDTAHVEGDKSNGVHPGIREKQRALIDALPMENYELPATNGAKGDAEGKTESKKDTVTANLADDTSSSGEESESEQESAANASSSSSSPEDESDSEEEPTISKNGAAVAPDEVSKEDEPMNDLIPLSDDVPPPSTSKTKSKKRKAADAALDPPETSVTSTLAADPLIFEDTAGIAVDVNDPSVGKPPKKKKPKKSTAPPDPSRPWDRPNLNRKLKPFEINRNTRMKLDAIARGEFTYEELGLKRPGEKRGDKYKREAAKREAKREARRTMGEEVPEKKKKESKDGLTKSERKQQRKEDKSERKRAKREAKKATQTEDP